MEIVVRPVEIGDLESVAELLVEMDNFYDELERESVETKMANMQEFLFGPLPSAYLLVAHDKSEAIIVGVAAYSFLWPAIGTTHSLYLKELYVSENHRTLGLGRALMDGLGVVARERGCTRVEWTTDRSNTVAQDFYTSLGAKRLETKIFYRS